MAKSREAFRTISEVADWLDVQTHVLRFWESKFSQVKPVKRAGGRRYYRPQDMELLGGLKKLLHEDGMPIKEAQQLLREKGVKHVSSLSRPVDEEADTLEAVSEDGADQAVSDPVKEAQADTQEDSPQEETLLQRDAEEASFDALAEASDALAEEHPALEDGLVTDGTEEALDEEETQVEDVPEEAFDAAPDNFEPTAMDTDTEDDDENAGIPEDLLVKIEDDVPAQAVEPEPQPADLPPSVPNLEQTTPDLDADERKKEALTESVSDELPPMGDLFGSLNTAEELAPTGEDEADAHASTEVPASEAHSDFRPAAVDAGAQAENSPLAHETSEEHPESSSTGTPLQNTAEPASEGADHSEASAPVASSAPDAPEPNTSVSTSAHEPVSTGTVTPKVDKTEAISSPPAATHTQNGPDLETVVARETARDDFLLMLTKPVTVERKDASRAADLLARLEALHGKAG